MRARRKASAKRVFLGLVSGLATLVAIAPVTFANSTSTADASPGTPGSLCASALACPGATVLARYNPTHYALPAGTTGTFAIVGATDVSGSATTVYVKSSTLGNTAVPGTVVAGPGGPTIWFRYAAPANGCDTTAVSYATTGNGANNDIIDDGVKNGSAGAAAGFAYVDASGKAIACSAAPPPAASPLTAGAAGSASYTRTYAWQVAKAVDRTSATYDTRDAAPQFDYTVTVSHDAGTDGGFAVSGSITASNPNGADVPGVSASIEDSHCSVSGGAQTVPAAGSATFAYACSFASAGPSSLTATVSWPSELLANGTALAAGSASGTAALDWTAPTKTVDSSVAVDDSLAGSLGTVTASDASPKTFSYPLQLAGTPGTCSDLPNTATITGSTSGPLASAGRTVTVCAVVDPSVDGASGSSESFTRTYGWSVAKTVDRAHADVPAGSSASFHYTVSVSHDAGTDTNWAATGTIVVDNANDSALAGVAAAVGDASCSVSTGAQTVPAHGSATFDYACSFASAPPASLALSASWPAQTLSNGPLAAGSAQGPASLDWSTPTTVVNGSVSVADSLGGSLGTVSAADASPTSFPYALDFAGTAGTCTDYPNTATITSADGLTAGAAATVGVCVGSDLGASSSLAPAFTRTYGWTVAKTVDRTVAKQIGGSATFSYSVAAAETGFTDSGWTATGTVHLTNPNDWEAIQANVAVTTDNGGTCTVSGVPVTVTASGAADVPVACTWTALPAPGTATVAVSWDALAAATPDGSASATTPADFTGVSPKLVGATATTSDSYAGTLGSLAATDAAPYAAATYRYSRSIPVPTWNCSTFGNTATIVQTGQSASQSVRVCGPARTGALSMGYWQSKNGQAILLNGLATSGVCNVGAWLRGYAPFADLSATASCQAVAGWVTTVIKAASAGGASMNAMLKAQMLAAALDVYFSDGSLGGNRIAAPGPVGPVAIDVSAWSGGFGGATALTVSQMLACAASQSSPGGTTWYGNAKSVQGLAKNAFDAIDNQTAFPA